LAAEYVAMVDRMTVGQWSQPGHMRADQVGKPLIASSKASTLEAMRVFFKDCQEWGWIPRTFSPQRALALPRSVRAKIGPNPRVIADDIWAKLLWAGLNLMQGDIPAGIYAGEKGQRGLFYPTEMVQALVMVWLFCGLRRSEILRLPVGCVRWQREDLTIAGTGEVLPKDAVCLLDVPVNKTSAAFTKPVDRVVGEAIKQWERMRPTQPASIDLKTGTQVHYLFSYRGRGVGLAYLNDRLIPMLCRKAGVEEQDARGNITSHRARSTIASQLYNAKDPMSLMELKEWLGHRWLSSTQSYAQISPTKLAKSFSDAGYFKRNLRTIEVLIDQDAVKSGAAASGASWKFYDLGHGYCTYDFFDQCLHRMACAKCAFYLPKGSSQVLVLEGRAHLQRMLQEIPLTEDERAAVEDGIGAMEKLCQQLAEVPTPAGPTPKQLIVGEQRRNDVISLEQVRRKK
jgi:integrase